MSAADAAWLHMDRPTNLMVINSLMLFDERVDFERLQRVVRRRLVDRYPRFRQRISERALALRPPSWEDDGDFALEHHVHHIALADPGDQRALHKLVGDLMATPLTGRGPCGTCTWSTTSARAARCSCACTTASRTASRWPACCCR